MDKDWNNEAKIILKSILTNKKIKYHELALALNNIGVDENYNLKDFPVACSGWSETSQK